MQKILSVLLVGIIILSFAALASAEENSASAKLIRGAKNVATGWIEIPKNIIDTSKKDGAIAGVTAGALKGVCQAFAKTVSGAVDVVTFPIGTYDKPAVQPSMIPKAEK